ncbi:unnamed protein product, partial [Rotaria sp. Silwood1]
MISPIRIAKLLVDRVTQNQGPHRRGTKSNPHEEEIINSLLKMIDDVCNCTSYQIESDTSLDYDDEEEYGDFEDEDTDSTDETVHPGFDESTVDENLMIKANFKARENILPVHDRDLKRWALLKATEDSSFLFEASEHWLRVFKHRHRICSRKITKLVTRHHAEDTDAIIESADSFVRAVKQQMQNYAHEDILYTNQ